MFYSLRSILFESEKVHRHFHGALAHTHTNAHKKRVCGGMTACCIHRFSSRSKRVAFWVYSEIHRTQANDPTKIKNKNNNEEEEKNPTKTIAITYIKQNKVGP